MCLYLLWSGLSVGLRLAKITEACAKGLAPLLPAKTTEVCAKEGLCPSAVAFKLAHLAPLFTPHLLIILTLQRFVSLPKKVLKLSDRHA